MKKLFWIAVIGILILVPHWTRAAQAGGEGISLADLAGSFAGTGGGFVSQCFVGTTPSACSDPSSAAVEFHEADVLRATRDQNGNECFSLFTDVMSPVGGSKLPADVSSLIAVISNNSYDPATGTGKESFSIFVSANGVSCSGAALVNPNGASPVDTGTQDIAASESGDRIDVIITSVSAPGQSGVVVTYTLHRQTRKH